MSILLLSETKVWTADVEWAFCVTNLIWLLDT
jgi:hypothetical protein